MIVPVFYALEKTKYPVIGGFIAVIANVLFVSFTIHLFQHKAIALSVSVTMIINFLFLFVILFKKLKGFSMLSLFSGLMKILTATCAMGLFIGLSNNFFPFDTAGHLFRNLFHLIILISTSVILYSFVLYCLKVEEFSELITIFRKKLR